MFRSRVSAPAPQPLPINGRWRFFEVNAEKLYKKLENDRKHERYTNELEFDAGFIVEEDKIYFPTCFYNRWADELGKYVVLKDEHGNRFIGFVSRNDKGAYFSFNQKRIRFMYQLTRFGIMTLLYVGNAKFEIKLIGHYLGRIDTNDPAKYNGHWGYDPMWFVEISESMARDPQPLLIPEHVVDIIYNGTVPYEIDVTTYETDNCYTWEVECRDTQFVIVGGWREYLRECITKGVKCIFFAMDGANYTVVSTLIT